MIDRWNPRTTLLVAFGMLLLGFILPLLMIMQVLRSTFLLNFIAYICSVGGLIVGMIGFVTYVKRSRRK